MLGAADWDGFSCNSCHGLRFDFWGMEVDECYVECMRSTHVLFVFVTCVVKQKVFLHCYRHVICFSCWYPYKSERRKGNLALVFFNFERVIDPPNQQQTTSNNSSNCNNGSNSKQQNTRKREQQQQQQQQHHQHHQRHQCHQRHRATAPAAPAAPAPAKTTRTRRTWRRR